MNNKNNKKDSNTFFGQEFSAKEVTDLLKEVMKEEGYETFIDSDGVEKPL